MLEKMNLDDVTVIHKEDNKECFPRYLVDDDPNIRSELRKNAIQELRDYVVSLPDKYDIFIDLHDNTQPRIGSRLNWLRKEAGYNYAKFMPDGRVYINSISQPEHEFAEIDLYTHLDLSDFNSRLESMKNGSKFPLEILTGAELDYDIDFASIVDVEIEFCPYRFKRSKSLELFGYSVKDGVSVVTDLITSLRLV
jgi:hypothetical protein